MAAVHYRRSLHWVHCQCRLCRGDGDDVSNYCQTHPMNMDVRMLWHVSPHQTLFSIQSSRARGCMFSRSMTLLSIFALQKLEHPRLYSWRSPLSETRIHGWYVYSEPDIGVDLPMESSFTFTLHPFYPAEFLSPSATNGFRRLRLGGESE